MRPRGPLTIRIWRTRLAVPGLRVYAPATKVVYAGEI